MDDNGVEFFPVDWDACSALSCFSVCRSSTFSNAASSHRYDHIKVNFQGLFFLTRIGLLTKSWHSWRLYASQKLVKTRLKDVARYDLKYISRNSAVFYLKAIACGALFLIFGLKVDNIVSFGL